MPRLQNERKLFQPEGPTLQCSRFIKSLLWNIDDEHEEPHVVAELIDTVRARGPGLTLKPVCRALKCACPLRDACLTGQLAGHGVGSALVSRKMSL